MDTIQPSGRQDAISLPKIWVGYLIAAVFLVVEVGEGISNPTAGDRVTPLPVLIAIGGWIYWLFCIYRMHEILKEVTNASYPITPGKAVGYQFIPFYNFYWSFKWPSEIAGFVNARSPSRRMSEGWAGFFLMIGLLLSRADAAIGLAIVFSVGGYLVRRIGSAIESGPSILEPMEVTVQSSDPTKASVPDVDDWVEKVVQRFSSEGFNISRDITHEGHTFRLVAHRSKFELSKFGNHEVFFVFAAFGALNVESMRTFSTSVFRYAKASKRVSLPCGFFESISCFPVGIVEGLDQVTSESLRKNAPPKHMGAMEIPVVYEYGQKKLCFFEKTPIFGAAYYAGLRRQIRRFLEPGSWEPSL